MMMAPTYSKWLEEAKAENPSRKKDDFIDVEFCDVTDEKPEITDQRKLEYESKEVVV